MLTRALDRKTIQKTLRVITHVGSLIPLLWLFWQYENSLLGVDPIREVLFQTGTASLVLLVLSLAVTPLNIVFNWKQLIPLRKSLGLYAFMYVSLHLLTFVWLDYGLAWGLIVDAIVQQPYVLVGFVAFLILLALAVTSTRWAMRKMGKSWKRLHQLVYVAAILAIVHFLWLVKNVYTEPLIYAAIVGLLLLTRFKPIKQAVLRWRRSRPKASTKASRSLS